MKYFFVLLEIHINVNTYYGQATHKNGKVLAFYSMPEYEAWKDSLGGNASGWSIKYYKVC